MCWKTVTQAGSNQMSGKVGERDRSMDELNMNFCADANNEKVLPESFGELSPGDLSLLSHNPVLGTRVVAVRPVLCVPVPFPPR